MQQFNWILAFKKFLFCFLILIAAGTSVQSIQKGKLTINPQYINRSFITATIYTVLSTYFTLKRNNE
jgi:hypothetical protein